MTPQLQAAIIAIQPLTLPERQQLLQLLTQNTPIAQLLLTQTPITLRKISDLKADFWPEEDSIEDFLLFRKNQN